MRDLFVTQTLCVLTTFSIDKMLVQHFEPLTKLDFHPSSSYVVYRIHNV